MGRNPNGRNSLCWGIPMDGVFLIGIPLGRSSLGGIPVREVSWEVSRGDEFLLGIPGGRSFLGGVPAGGNSL